MHIIYFYLLYFKKNGNVIFKTIFLLEDTKCNSELFYHKFLYNYLCTYCIITMRHSEYCHRSDRKMLGKNNNLWFSVFINVHLLGHYTGRFIMFSVITNIYNKKTKRPTLMEFFTTKLKKVFLQLEMFDVCTTGDTAHIDTILKLLPHTRVVVKKNQFSCGCEKSH